MPRLSQSLSLRCLFIHLLKSRFPMRTYRRYSYKDTNLRVACIQFDEVVNEVVTQRKLLERYIRRQPEFVRSLEPLQLLEDAPEVVLRMAAASEKTGLGPMAAVAGTLAQLGAEKAMALGVADVIVENGGDLYIAATTPVVVGIHSGDDKFGDSLGFQIPPGQLAICSSSSRMGHSLSFGKCTLATAVSAHASLADAAATLLCNSIQCADDLESAVAKVGAIEGVDGTMAIMDGKIGLCGNLPQIIRNIDPSTKTKVTRDRYSLLD